MKKKVLFLSLILLISLIFVDIVGAETYNNFDVSATLQSCGDGMLDKIPPLVPQVVSVIYNVVQVAVPVVLIIMGMLDLTKGITAGKEDEMKKGQQLLIKRVIAAILVFLVFIVVKLVISFVADKSTSNIMDCAECFINNNCD